MPGRALTRLGNDGGASARVAASARGERGRPRRAGSAGGLGARRGRAAQAQAAALRPRITERPAILVTQGDPLEATGISVITRLVADELAIPRALVTLPASIDPEHAPNAPREGVILEVGYDALAASLEEAGSVVTSAGLF